MPIDPFSLAIGGGVSAIGGGLAGYFSGEASKDAAEKQRDFLKELVEQIGQESTQLSAEERDRALVAQRRAERLQRETLTRAQQRAEGDLRNLIGSPQYQAQARYITQQFTQGIPDVLASEYQGRIRQAQASRGLAYGGEPTQQEAATLTKLAEQGRQALLPQLRQLALDPTQLRQGLASNYLGLTGQAQAQGLAQLQGNTSSRTAAQQIAQSRIGPLTSLLSQQAQLSPFSAASPGANLLYGISSGLGQLAGGLLGSSGLFGGGNDNAGQ